MRPTMKLLYSSAVAASFLLLQPVQAQAPAQPAASAAAADAADIQQQAADAFGKAVSAAARCDREELARQLALLESLNARMTQVSQTAAAGRRAARRVPKEFGGEPEADNDSLARAEVAVGRLLAHARNLVPVCTEPDPASTATAPPTEDIPTLEAEPAPPGFFDGYEGKGTVSAPYPLDTDERLLREYGTMPLPPENGAAGGDATGTGGAEGAGAASPPEQMEGAPPPPKPSGDGASKSGTAWPSSRDWPSKADPSDLKAKNSETAVEQMEAPPSRTEICDESADPSADCPDQQPPQRKPRPSEKRKPR